ncbi:probable O-methyltransferase 3 [Hibiscus syriacus]|uniref:probable O-methyltransferase 3 n=1 Tax=Hibiscus syriacus TaxID=106335 RepID=UPI001920EDB3|nr:probable O-methyltransferase 3 [Hibiscus syriacus]
MEKNHGALNTVRIQSYYPWHSLNVRVLESGDILPFEAANGMDLWSYTEANPGHSKLFNDTTACSSRHTISAILEGCPQVFDGVESLVDVGGGNGTALSVLVSNSQGFEASTSISLMFSAVAPTFDIIENWVLHDWDDEECIKNALKSYRNVEKQFQKTKGRS